VVIYIACLLGRCWEGRALYVFSGFNSERKRRVMETFWLFKE
jgi:hypothetical protein